MLQSFANAASLLVLMATITGTVAQPTKELADRLAAETASTAAAPKWALAVFAQGPGPAACSFTAVRQVDSSEQGSGCKRFASGPKAIQFNGDGKFRLTVCPGGITGDVCDDPRCVTQESTGLLPCTRMSGFEFYKVS
ncbi:hypothetical protein NQ176_g3212 [Zarea fungicola]|uniref:Uncharacterized protein n=1 Tax=Zarea fungicola TaxID=93591 RepID=A0ACC1NJL1_9HYPO|nr:hypothetical protein NQ176_g3212 [Lecanicillium fungicola]